MALFNCTRSGCKDIFKSYLVRTAEYASDLEIPIIQPDKLIPDSLIPFSKSLHSEGYEATVHFYEDDANFERLWNKPNKYIGNLKKFNGVILPDFSLYRDMPLVMQYWNIYRSRALGHWFQENSIKVIPNIRFGDKRTYDLCCTGIQEHDTIAIGSHGCLKIVRERQFFVEGLAYVIEKLKPERIIVYGKAPDDIFSCYRESGISILQFDSDYSLAHSCKGGTAYGRG